MLLRGFLVIQGHVSNGQSECASSTGTSLMSAECTQQ